MALIDDAVLDRETGLVWERSTVRAGTAQDPATKPWLTAVDFCQKLGKGGRYGWRLPTEEELRSVSVAWDSADDPFTLPQNFGDVQSYWTSRTVSSPTAQAYAVLLDVPETRQAEAKTTMYGAWCVRGGQALDGM